MNRGLGTLLRLRRLEVEAAKRALANAVAAEAAAEQCLAEARDAPRREASRLADDAGELRNFAAWLPHASAAVQSAASAVKAASQQTALARAALGERQAACKAVETLVEKAVSTIKKHQARREGHVLDDVIRGRRG